MDKLPTTFPSTGATAGFFWTILPTPLWLKMRSALQPQGSTLLGKVPRKKKTKIRMLHDAVTLTGRYFSGMQCKHYGASIYVPGSGSPPHPPCHGHGHDINPPPPCGMGWSWEAAGVIQPTAMQQVG